MAVVTGVDVEALKDAAEKATPGPWREVATGSEGYHIYEHRQGATVRNRPRRVARCTYEDWETDKANAEFIAAANPAAVLALITERDGLQRQVDAALSLLASFDPTSGEARARTFRTDLRRTLLRVPAPPPELGMAATAADLDEGQETPE